jgi:hypothetical protein
MLRLAGIHISRRRGIRVATLLLSECTKTLSVADTTRHDTTRREPVWGRPVAGSPVGGKDWLTRGRVVTGPPVNCRRGPLDASGKPSRERIFTPVSSGFYNQNAR